MPGDGPGLLRMPDIVLLSITRVMCETIDNKTTGRKIDSQAKHVANSHDCKTNKDPQVKAYGGSTNKDKSNMPDYLIPAKSRLICQIILTPVKQRIRQKIKWGNHK